MQLFHLMGHYIIAILVQWTSQMEEDMLGGVFCWAKQVFLENDGGHMRKGQLHIKVNDVGNAHWKEEMM